MDEYDKNDMSNKMSMLMLLEYFNKRTATCAHFSKTKSTVVIIKIYTKLLDNEIEIFRNSQIMSIHHLSFYKQFLNTPLQIYAYNMTLIDICL